MVNKDVYKVLVSINAVTLHWARLVVGWVTAFGQVNCLTMEPATQANLAFHPSRVNKWVPAIAGKAMVWLLLIADERVGMQVKLWNPLRTSAIPERFWGDDSGRSAISSVSTFTVQGVLVLNDVCCMMSVDVRSRMRTQSRHSREIRSVIILSVWISATSSADQRIQGTWWCL